MIIDFQSNYNLQNKKYDYVKIAFILSNVEGFVTANQINYYFNQIFPQNYCNSGRIAQIIRQRPSLFECGLKINGITKTYKFKGKLLLNKTTKINWENKSKEFFLNTPKGVFNQF